MGAFCPDERLGSLVVGQHEQLDCGYQFVDILEYAALERASQRQTLGAPTSSSCAIALSGKPAAAISTILARTQQRTLARLDVLQPSKVGRSSLPNSTTTLRKFMLTPLQNCKDQLARAGRYAKGVRAKFRTQASRTGNAAVLNFDLTPFACLIRCRQIRLLLKILLNK